MKRLITLLLFWPALSSGQFFCPPYSIACYSATSGSMVDRFGDQQVPYSLAGPFSSSGVPEFSTSGVIFFAVPTSNPVNNPVLPGESRALVVQADTANPDLGGVTLSVQGTPWVLPDGSNPGFARVNFTSAILLFTGPGTYRSTFTFFSNIDGVPLSVQEANPGKDCDQLMCPDQAFSGGGSVTVDVVPYPGLPGALAISQASFTFVPEPSTVREPSTTALLLLGFAALGFQVWGRTRRARSAH